MVALFTNLHWRQPEIASLRERTQPEPDIPIPVIACHPLFSFEGRPGGIAVGPDRTIYVSDPQASAIWRVDPGGDTERYSPPPASGQSASDQSASDQSASDQGRLFGPAGIALRADGSLVVADPSRHRISLVGPDRSVRVLAGGLSGYRDGTAGEAMFHVPMDVAVAPDGTCYVADTGNHRIRAISPEGEVTTLAGSIYDFGDGLGPHARFRVPGSVDVDAEGVCYVADTGNNAIRRLWPDGTVATLAGGPVGGDRDGAGRAASLRWPGGVAAATDGSIWVADFGNGSLRHLSAIGETATVFKISGLGYPTAVAALADGGVVVAGFSSSGDSHTACVMVHRADRLAAPLGSSR
ncbi:hypothetical protein K6U06_16750 [Acidiferrimicrobium sp. IK]|uniref:hypothetical protein n=1 Tax=Acidiferrimicrobium sp. IK TaxID=2871700 RepID=UPI0021CB1949|nr:hypothetical protein [Acidiferrimicrobium sp. IK]MCU4186021.1 hypothetical protein [Acidiferrimicrobium sp. IK]